MNKKMLNIVWLKRDLRLQDHKPLQQAQSSSIPYIIIYLFEPSLVNAPQSSYRHWLFVQQSINEMQSKISPKKITVIYNEAITFFSLLKKNYLINAIYSYQETGLQVTYQRDKTIKKFCIENGITWHEYQNNGVIRGLKNRDNWNKEWIQFMSEQQAHFNIDIDGIIDLSDVELNAFHDEKFKNKLLEEIDKIDVSKFQQGGENKAHEYLNSFINNRAAQYTKGISKPDLSRTTCSRISPYLAWGNISMKQVYQAVRNVYATSSNKRELSNFSSRLFWHCHFIQKFESDDAIEFKNLNKAFDSIRTEHNEQLYTAWATGKTGYPLIDACMRCVNGTGYLNFRMRAMLVSFLTHNLWQPWQAGAIHLAQQFLDFEPGIHYAQFQMQAGTLGVNTIRTYNPVKQSYDHDPYGIFIKKWIPELKLLPNSIIHEPWKLTMMEQTMYQCKIGIDYPFPIIDYVASAKEANQKLWSLKKTDAAKEENAKILSKHVKKKKVTT